LKPSRSICLESDDDRIKFRREREVQGRAQSTGGHARLVAAHENRLYLILRDQAPVFDPQQAPAPRLDLPLHLRPKGGMGVHLIRRCVDELCQQVSITGGNELVLVKYLSEDRRPGESDGSKG